MRSRILGIYYPEDFPQIHASQHIEKILLALGVPESDLQEGLFLNQRRLMEIKNGHPIMTKWSTIDFSHFIWHLVIDRTNRSDLKQGPVDGETGPHAAEEVTTKSWTSLTKQDIEQIASKVLAGEDGRRLEIDPEIVRRIINHLISGKHVILVGPPGTGKTDLASRLLRELGLQVYGKEDFTVAVASYEWGRFEVIGGNSLKMDADGNYSFHLGCVLTALNEDKMLLIDEFNRADMNKAFGEMFRAVDHGIIELRADEIPPKSLTSNGVQSELTSNAIAIPNRFRIICTMNDYDKSILNELSYGLLRRFAFVEVDSPRDKEVIKRIIKERVAADLHNLDDEKVRDTLSKIENDLLDKFVDFTLRIKNQRSIGVSTLIDIIRYLVVGKIIREDDPWKLFGEALVDYILPQLDRLDSTTLIAVREATDIFKSNGVLSENISSFVQSLDEMIRRIQSVGELFKKE